MELVAPCPAFANARGVIQLEACIASAGRFLSPVLASGGSTPARTTECLEEAWAGLLSETEDARTGLADVAPTTVAGAVAQLLAAIRDIRIGDDFEIARARTLERQAVGFFIRSGLIDAGFAEVISQTDPHAPGLEKSLSGLSLAATGSTPDVGAGNGAGAVAVSVNRPPARRSNY